MTEIGVNMVESKIADQLTVTSPLTALGHLRLELVESVEDDDDLYRTQCVKEMRVVSRPRTEATIIVQTREYKVEQLRSWEGIGRSQQMSGCQTPVDTT